MKRNKITLHMVEKPLKGSYIDLYGDLTKGLVIKTEETTLCDRVVYKTKVEVYTIEEIRNKKINDILNEE